MRDRQEEQRRDGLKQQTEPTCSALYQVSNRVLQPWFFFYCENQLFFKLLAFNTDQGFAESYIVDVQVWPAEAAQIWPLLVLIIQIITGKHLCIANKKHKTHQALGPVSLHGWMDAQPTHNYLKHPTWCTTWRCYDPERVSVKTVPLWGGSTHKKLLGSFPPQTNYSRVAFHFPSCHGGEDLHKAALEKPLSLRFLQARSCVLPKMWAGFHLEREKHPCGR